MRRIFAIATILLAAGLSLAAADRTKCKVLEERKHDSGSYTQGLFFYGDKLYESAGQYGSSSLRIVDPVTGKVLKRKNFDRRYFLEGSCICNGMLYLLTWQENVCFVCDPATLETVGQLCYQGEGWGLTTDGKSLIMSNGSSVLTWRKPANFAVEKELVVTLNGREVPYLNELEYIDGVIWANVYTTDTIVRIDPETGKVLSSLDCSGILPAYLKRPSTDVLNGIAYNTADSTLWITGKLWPRIYKIDAKTR